MVKSYSKRKLTNIGTGHGLKQVNGLNGPDDARWGNIRLKNQNRDLVISNIQSDQSGVYKVEINTISMVFHRKFKIAVGDSGLSPGVIAGICVAVVVLVILIAFCCWINKKRGYNLARSRE
ncbi:hypothetical protein ROHU_027862 [Labeo rohita]|uniref:Uncharacterized protein n=1 Tax=Labeo rohita TaxID=84645 RepID=A0A498M8W3_LABRO|nr:hypothetical protein ROHU_027862 [Labeo rohita]